MDIVGMGALRMQAGCGRAGVGVWGLGESVEESYQVATGPWGISREHGQGRGWVSLGSGGWDSVLFISAEHLTCARLVSLYLTVYD